MRSLFVLFSFLFVFISTDAQAQKASPKPKPYTSKAGKYSISFPKAPTETRELLPIEGLGDCELVMAIAEMSGSSTYIVSYTDFPKEMIDLAIKSGELNIDELLVSTKEGTFNSQGISTSSEEFLTVQNQRALFAKGTNEAAFSHLQVMFVGNRLYQIIITQENAITDKESKAFFGSFKLLK